jgi:hypothetical protein
MSECLESRFWLVSEEPAILGLEFSSSHGEGDPLVDITRVQKNWRKPDPEERLWISSQYLMYHHDNDTANNNNNFYNYLISVLFAGKAWLAACLAPSVCD